MHGIVQAFGALVFIIGAIGCIAALSGAGPSQSLAFASIPLLLSGALLYCFGTMVERLNQICDYTERQARATEMLAKQVERWNAGAKS